MAQRRRFKPDPDFEIEIDRVILGAQPLVGIGRSSVRRRSTTLQDVANNVISEAKEITASEEFGLPSLDANGQRNDSYLFRRTDRRGRRYIDSFSSSVQREAGRLVIVVINDHEHAHDIEYGSGAVGNTRSAGGRVVGPSRSANGYYALPITKRAYNKIRRSSRASAKGENVPSSSLEYKRAMERERYYKHLPKKRFEELESAHKRTRSPSKREDILERQQALRERSLRSAKAGAEAIQEAEHQRTRQRPDALKKFVSIPKTSKGHVRAGQPYLFTRTFKTYGGYGILKRAMKRVTINQLQ